MRAPLEETVRRWGDFRGGRFIPLPGRQSWAFYEPQARLVGAVAGTREPLYWTFDAPPDIDAVLSRKFLTLARKYVDAVSRASDEDTACAILEAAWFLLARNYDLTQDEFGAILARMTVWDDDRQAELMNRLHALVAETIARAAMLRGTV